LQEDENVENNHEFASTQIGGNNSSKQFQMVGVGGSKTLVNNRCHNLHMLVKWCNMLMIFCSSKSNHF